MASVSSRTTSSSNSSSLSSRKSSKRSKKSNNNLQGKLVQVKSRFCTEFRRFSIDLDGGEPFPSFEEFQNNIFDLHLMETEQRDNAILTYASEDGGTLPLNNDENVRQALEKTQKLLRVEVRQKGENLDEEFGYGVNSKTLSSKRKKISISAPQDFRRVSAILDVDQLPCDIRRVRLCKFYNNKPLGFFIRDGRSTRVTPWSGPRRGIFVSRLLPNGLAASTNLLHVDDEILEVNGIDVGGKTLDQVTDIMIANSSNLILTVRVAPSWQPMMPCPNDWPGYPSRPPFEEFHPSPIDYPSPSRFHPAAHMAQFGPPPPPPYPFAGFMGGPPCYGSPMGNPYFRQAVVHQMRQRPEDDHRLSNLHQYSAHENIPDIERLRISNGTSTFSRESTWRVSDKRQSTPKSEERRRPFSVHCPTNMPPYPGYPYPY